MEEAIRDPGQEPGGLIHLEITKWQGLSLQGSWDTGNSLKFTMKCKGGLAKARGARGGKRFLFLAAKRNHEKGK